MYHRNRMRKAATAYMKMRGGNGGGGGRRRRPLDHGDLRLLILSLIAERPRHGYDLMNEIEARTGGTYKPSAGVMYPALEVIQDMGLAKSKKEDGKRVFSITPDGEAELEANAETLTKIQSQLDALAAPKSDPMDVRSASRSLRYVVFQTVAEEWPDTSKHEEIIAILNQAREDIKKLNGGDGANA